MKCSELWLREWVNPDLTREALSTILTMAGLEVEEFAPVAKELSGVIVGEIVKVEKHPEADKLKICEVNIGSDHLLKIVCGAPNARLGLKIPVAQIGAVLPHDITIKPATIRGVPSQGMLCSAKELGLSEDNLGLLELSSEAKIGENINSHLSLNDYVIDVSITPNRGDCLSVRGLAREISALTQTPLIQKDLITAVPAASSSRDLPGEGAPALIIKAPSACPVYLGRVIKKVKADAETPALIKERLRRSGIRSINSIVDVTNYVMLELGQPMHAFDLSTIEKEIQVRLSKSNEKITLLDGSEKELDDQTLVIADAKKPLAIAGVMGGMDSSVTSLTQDIFLESAFFTPETIARQRQFYQLTSDSAYRFERGVDPSIQREALERATQLILEIAGGEAASLVEFRKNENLTKKNIIRFAHSKIAQVLGLEIPREEIEKIFKALGFVSELSYELNQKLNHESNQESNLGIWQVEIPRFRFDLSIPEDLIEEIARVYGYDKIPTHTLKAELQTNHANETSVNWQPLRQFLSDLAYHEIISYSFIDSKLQKLLSPTESACELVNPITAEMTVMRTNLWPGLITTLLYNKSRQQNRIRLFEMGSCFIKTTEGVADKNNLLQQQRLGGLATGGVNPEQWGQPSRELDFFDVKGDIERLLSFVNSQVNYQFKPGTHPCLHPGQTAEIYDRESKIGVVGALHPSISQALDIKQAVFVYEIDMHALSKSKLIKCREVSKFPEIRRDLAIIINEAIPAAEIQDTIKVIAGDWLKDIFIFDVYQGKGISPGLKSIALGLILQDLTRTLIDEEVTALMERITTALKEKLGAELRR